MSLHGSLRLAVFVATDCAVYRVSDDATISESRLITATRSAGLIGFAQRPRVPLVVWVARERGWRGGGQSDTDLF